MSAAWVAGTPMTLVSWWPVRRPRPSRGRIDATAPLLTGQRVIDAVYPVAKGGAAAVPGGFGTGKTMLLQQIAKWCDADVIVYVGCGERGNEMADVVSELASLTDPRTGGRLADRTVLVANTSNMPIMAREASVYTGVTVAEYYRDMGYDAVVIADSTSRWAEALREFSSRTGAMPAEEGYPARRGRIVAVLAEADRLASLADLVGVGALPGPERMTMLGGRLLREAVLQQSALSANDAYCSREKTAALVDLVFAVVDRCGRLVADGMPASQVEELDFATVVRAREETPPSDVAGVRATLARMMSILDGLR